MATKSEAEVTVAQDAESKSSPAVGKHKNGIPNIPINRPELTEVETLVTLSPASSDKAAFPPVTDVAKVWQYCLV